MIIFLDYALRRMVLRRITRADVEHVVAHPVAGIIQDDHRVCLWGCPPGRRIFLRVVLTADRTAVINAMEDGGFSRQWNRRRMP